MRTFNDNAGRTWTIAINVDTIRRVRSLVSVDLLEAVEGKLIERLAGDPILFCMSSTSSANPKPTHAALPMKTLAAPWQAMLSSMPLPAYWRSWSIFSPRAADNC